MSDRPMPRTPMVTWDEHRNTSRVFPVPPDALPDALKALRSMDSRLRQWIEDGYPNLSEAEHLARFGEPFSLTRTKNAAPEREETSSQIGMEV